MNVIVSRSPMKLLAYAVFAVPAILLAIDMTFAYRFYPEPANVTNVVGTTVDQFGNTIDITTKTYTLEGKAQRRRDLAYSALLLGGGAAAMGWAVYGLLKPKSILRTEDAGISIAVDGAGRPNRLFPWDSIVEVRSGVMEVDGAPATVLSIELDDPSMVPRDPAGGIADPPWLHLFADDWDPPAHQVAPFLDPRVHRQPDAS